MKKSAALLAAVVMVISLLSGCGKPSYEDKETTAEISTTAAESVTETEAPYSEKDSLPDNLNFSGQTVTFLNWKEALCPEFDAQISGDIIEDAVYNRNAAVESRLNIKLVFNGIPGNNTNMDSYIKEVEADVMSGNAQYDVFASYSMCGASMAIRGYTADLLSQEYLDFTKPWWPENLIGQATINNKLYFCSGDISTNMLYYMFVMFFNRSMIDSMGLADPYGLVNSGKWTVDKMTELTSGMYQDLNSNNSRDSSDRYGVVAVTNVWTDSFFFAAGLSTVKQDKDGKLVISDTWCSEKSQTLLTKLCAFFNVSDGFLGTDNTSSRACFTGSNCLFIIDSAGSAKDVYASSDVSFGVVPVPKYDEAQENYYTTLGFTYTMYSISKMTSKNDVSAAALECLASEAYRGTTPEIIEKAFKYKYSSCEENIPMWDIIKSSVSFDLGRVFSSSMGKLTYSLFRNALTKNQADSWYSTFAANESALDGYIKSIMNAFDSKK